MLARGQRLHLRRRLVLAEVLDDLPRDDAAHRRAPGGKVANRGQELRDFVWSFRTPAISSSRCALSSGRTAATPIPGRSPALAALAIPTGSCSVGRRRGANWSRST